MICAPIEYRVLTALLLQSATMAELALWLSVDRLSIQHPIELLVDHLAIYPVGHADNKHKSRVYALTRSGRNWAESIIYG